MPVIKSLFQHLKHMFHALEYVFHCLEYMFQTLEQKLCHREKTFTALFRNNLSTMFQKTQNKGMLKNQHDIIYRTPLNGSKTCYKITRDIKES